MICSFNRLKNLGLTLTIASFVVQYSLLVSPSRADYVAAYHNLTATVTAQATQTVATPTYSSPFFINEKIQAAIQVQVGTNPVAKKDEKVLSGPYYACQVSSTQYRFSQSDPWQEAPYGSHWCEIYGDSNSSTTGQFTLYFVGYNKAYWKVTLTGFVSYNGNYDNNAGLPITWDNNDNLSTSTGTVPVFVTGDWGYTNPDPYQYLPQPPFDQISDYPAFDYQGVADPKQNWLVITKDCHPNWCCAEMWGQRYFKSGQYYYTSATPAQVDSGHATGQRKEVWYPLDSNAPNTNFTWSVPAEVDLSFSIIGDSNDADYPHGTASAAGNASVVVSVSPGSGSQSLQENLNSPSATSNGNPIFSGSIGLPTGFNINWPPISQPPASASRSMPCPKLLTNTLTAQSSVLVSCDLDAQASVSWSNNAAGPQDSRLVAQVTGSGPIGDIEINEIAGNLRAR